VCSISGALIPAHRSESHTLIRIDSIVALAAERGRDSVGVYTDGDVWRTVTKEPLPQLHCSHVALANNRAEPTTEWVEHKRPEDAQPYRGDGIVLVHNGTIANDAELAAQLGIERPNIDTKVLVPLLAAYWDRTGPGLARVLRERVVGSYALAVYDEHSDVLHLASNYKPIYTEWRDGAWLFASLDRFLPGWGSPRAAISKVPPYSVTTIDGKTGTLQRTALQPSATTGRALVVCSGGLDSTVTAAVLQRDGYDVTLLHFGYRARATAPEAVAVAAVAERLGVPLLTVETDLFATAIGGSRLTGTKEAVAEGEAGAELAHEWVPARNLIMLSIATGIAEARGIDTIALGNNLEESGAYPDNEQEFVHTFNAVLPNAVNLGRSVRVVEPVGNLMKHEIVRLGLDVGAPLDITWSCYEAGELHCGSCGPCYMRRRAFEMNGAAEVIEYAS
jgi:7-cyano-7-deazaguanine synthase